MEKTEDYSKIKAVFAENPLVEIREKHGGNLRFPVYMTKSLEKTDIDALELSMRSLNCLRRVGIRTIGDLCERIHGSGDLRSIRNCGRMSAAEIMDNLFMYQYLLLRPEKRTEFLKTVIEMSVGSVG